jgi:nicotinamidase-related amidase
MMPPVLRLALPKWQQADRNSALFQYGFRHVECMDIGMQRKSAQSRTNEKPNRGRVAGNAPKTGAFGPAPHNAWSLNAAGLSLVRKAVRPRPLRFEALPQAIEIDVARSAVVVVDMQNDFCHAEGWFGQKGIDVRPMRKPIQVITKLLPAWRKAGGAVVWLNWGVRPDRLNLSPTIQFQGRKNRGGRHDGTGYAERSPRDRGRSLVPGDWGARIVDELTIAPADIAVSKHRLSGFWDNELDSILRQQAMTTLLFAGVNTDRCVFSTLQDAGFLGYDCVLLEDACSTPSPAYVTRAIHFIVQQLHGFVASTAALLASLSRLPSNK